MGAYIGDVCDPHLVGLLYRECALQSVGCSSCWHPNPVARPLVSTHRTQLGMAHQARNAFFSTQHAIFTQIAMHTRTAVNVLAALKEIALSSAAKIHRPECAWTLVSSSMRNSHCVEPEAHGTCFSIGIGLCVRP